MYIEHFLIGFCNAFDVMGSLPGVNPIIYPWQMGSELKPSLIKSASQNWFYLQMNKNFRTISPWSENSLIIQNFGFREVVLSFGIGSIKNK